MVAYGQQVGAALRAGDVVLLHGDLGAGKTTLAQGIARGLGIDGPVQSPTFGLVSEHSGTDDEGTPVRLYHLDLYRLESSGELEDLGYEQFIAPTSAISLVEWPERAEDWLPERFLLLRIEHTPGGGRTIIQSRHGDQP